MTRKVNKETIDLIVSFEGIAEKRSDGKIYPYHDCIGLPTIGIGHLLSSIKNESLDKYLPLSIEEAYKLFKEDLTKFEEGVNKFLSVELSDNEFGAIVSLAYNIGLGNLSASTLRKKLIANVTKLECGDEFLKWDKAGGKQVAGLTRRRKAERELFLKV
jgi:GH24 family phage-related lysozyme (muramidase)